MKVPENLQESKPKLRRLRPITVQDIDLPFAAVLALVFKWSVAAVIVGAGWAVVGVLLWYLVWNMLSPETAPRF